MQCHCPFFFIIETDFRWFLSILVGATIKTTTKSFESLSPPNCGLRPKLLKNRHRQPLWLTCKPTISSSRVIRNWKAHGPWLKTTLVTPTSVSILDQLEKSPFFHLRFTCIVIFSINNQCINSIWCHDNVYSPKNGLTKLEITTTRG